MTKIQSVLVSFFFVILITLIGCAVTKLDDVATELEHTQQELKQAQEGYKKVNAQLQDAKQEIQDLNQITETLQQRNNELRKQVELKDEEVNKLKEKIRKVQQTAVVMPSRGTPNKGRAITVASTAYTAYCKGCSGLTKWKELNLRKNPNLKVIAVDPNVIPLGSKVYVEGYGYAVAADIGGGIDGHEIDVFIPNLSDALAWGRKTITVRILES